MNESEKNRVNSIAEVSKYGAGVNKYTIEYSGKLFLKYMKPNGSVLEMGPAEGIMTDKLIDYFDDYTIVDGAQIFVDNLLKKYPQIKGTVSLFEDYIPGRKFDNIILGHVLEHVENPVEVLKIVKSFLTEDGVILAAVPNCNSIHRQAAVIMGLLKRNNELNEIDCYHGHRRVYSYEEFKEDFKKAGLNVLKSGGYWLKPVSNKQLEDSWSEEMIWAFMQLGEEYPEIAAEIYVVAGV